ncbi:hypothetical protein N6H14_14995 [Paenibacillus sp. CC-CFT747]|nr:hypothetical protein N6H14_14995 [Paenibacillus sp. CC-CFT747]
MESRERELAKKKQGKEAREAEQRRREEERKEKERQEVNPLTFLHCEFDKSKRIEIKGYLIATNKR